MTKTRFQSVKEFDSQSSAEKQLQGEGVEDAEAGSITKATNKGEG